MVNNTITTQFEGNKPLNVATVTVNVEMNPSSLVTKLADEIHADMSRIANLVGISNLGMESEDILKYLKTLTFIRVGLVNEDRSKALASYTRLVRHLSIPVMYYQCLISMGVAVDRDFSIEFRPTYSIDSNDLLSPEDMQSISEFMGRLETNGFKMCVGIPTELEGELDFMALSHVEEQILGYKRSHPVYGFLAAFFAQHQLSEVTGMMCRVLYGYETDYLLYVSSIYRALNK